MKADENEYLQFLDKVQEALDEALEHGVVPRDHHQRAELESMREEVVQVRQAIREQPQQPALRAVGAR